MDLGSAGELVTLGADIVKLGMELKTAKAALSEAQARVQAIELELQPKLLRHTELIREAVGIMVPTPAVAPAVPFTPPVTSGSVTMPTPAPAGPVPAGDPTKNRIKDFLKNRVKDDDTISANDVADVLKVDAALVREAMREIRTGR